MTRFGALVERVDVRIPGSGLPLLSVSQTRGVVRRSELTDSPARAESLDHYKVCRAGDIVFNKMSIRAGAMGDAREAGLVTYHYEVMRPRSGVDPRFVVYLMKSAAFTSEMIRRERGIAAGDDSGAVRTTEVPFRVLRTIDTYVPEPSDQRAIADYLDRETAQIDAFIAKNEELIALLKERRAAAIELAVAPRELPSTWDTCQVRRLGPKNESGVSVNGYSVPAEDDQIGVLKTGAVSKGYFDPNENKRVVEEDLARVAAPVRGGSLIVNRANTPDLVGRAAYVPNGYPTLFLSDKLWQLTFELADPAYMHFWTLSDAYRSQLRGLSVGASSSMQNLSYSDFLSVTISIPPLAEQREIVSRLNRVTEEIDAAVEVAQRGVRHARERRAALISAAVTGKIDVGVAA